MGFLCHRIHDVALFVNSKYFPLVHHRQATAQFHPLMANEVSVATQVSKTRAFKQRRTPSPSHACALLRSCVCLYGCLRVCACISACLCLRLSCVIMCVRARALSRDVSSYLHDAIPCVVPSLYILKRRRVLPFLGGWFVRLCVCLWGSFCMHCPCVFVLGGRFIRSQGW